MNNIQLFDNYEEDGQLSMFASEELSGEEEEPLETEASTVRIGRCGSCGKLLFVREEDDGYRSACNNCGVGYFQKK